MQSKVRLFVLLLVLVAVIVGAYFAYHALAQQVQPTEPTAPQTEILTDVSEQTAADFTVYTADGTPVRLAEQLDKPTVVNFWASWCGPCREELPAFQDCYHTYGDKINFMFVNLTDGYHETVEGVLQFAAENGYDFPIYFDTDVSAAQAYQIYSIPVTVFLFADGRILHSQIGAMSEAQLTALLDALAKG